MKIEQFKSANSSIVLKGWFQLLNNYLFKDFDKNYVFAGLTFVNVTGLQFKVAGLGPFNWVWKVFIIGSVKKSVKKL